MKRKKMLGVFLLAVVVTLSPMLLFSGGTKEASAETKADEGPKPFKGQVINWATAGSSAEILDEMRNLVNVVRREVIHPLLSSPKEFAGSQDQFVVVGCVQHNLLGGRKAGPGNDEGLNPAG